MKERLPGPLLFTLKRIKKHFLVSTIFEVLTKTSNDLKQPTTSKKQHETTYIKQETAWNYPQRVRYNIEWPEHTYNELRKMRNNQQQADFQIIVQYGANTFSTQHLVAVIWAWLHGESRWKQSIKHLLPCIKRQLTCIFFKGCNFFFFSVWVSSQ